MPQIVRVASLWLMANGCRWETTSDRCNSTALALVIAFLGLGDSDLEFVELRARNKLFFPLDFFFGIRTLFVCWPRGGDGRVGGSLIDDI